MDPNIDSKMKAHTPPDRTVMTMAKTLGLSSTMPRIPKISDNGNVPSISSAPSTASGSPQPGLLINMTRNVTAATANNHAEIFPNRMGVLSLFEAVKSRL